MSNFRCADLGMDCSFEVKNGTNRDEVMQIAAIHAKNAHGMETIPPDLAAKVASAIH